MNQIANNLQATPSAPSVGTRLQHARLAKGYSLDDLATTTGLTVEEIIAVEEDHGALMELYVSRIEHALR